MSRRAAPGVDGNNNNNNNSNNKHRGYISSP